MTVIFWFIVALSVLFFVTQPVSLQAHLVAALLAAAMIMVLKWLRPEGVWRHVALALGTAVVLRYVYWRTTSTLPPITQPENFIPGILLYSAEMYSVAMLGLSLFAVLDPLPSRKPPAEISDADLPTVDVFVPSYNEHEELLGTTLAAAKAMDYPADKFTVWLLDDGGTDQKCDDEDAANAIAAQKRRKRLQQLCKDMNVRYLTRARNEHAKAGNLNNGLAHSRAELVAVFDADHAPTQDFLRRTVGYFKEDERLFLVQTPHFFINPDPLERNLQTFKSMPSENEMFYGLIQRGLDRWNASFFCGSAALMRRAALEQSNGFSGVSITEDCETAIDLHARGWRSLYVDRPLVAGLQPATFASFIGQRTRWAQGMMQIIMLKRPLIKRGLSFAQRMCYASSTLFWLFPFSRLIFLIAPLFFLFGSLKIFNASGEEFLGYIATYMLINILLQNYLYGRYRWSWISELYEYVQSVYLFRAVISAVFNPRKPTFRVTAKGDSLAENRISELAIPFYIIFAVLIVGVFATIWRLIAQPYDADITLVVGGWNLLNLILVGGALGVVSERRDLRRSERVDLMRRCEIAIQGRQVPGTIVNASTGGVRLRLPAADLGTIRPGDSLELGLDKPRSDTVGRHLPMTIRSVRQDDDVVQLGCGIDANSADTYRIVADIVFSDSDNWVKFQESRRNNIGVIKATAWFLMLATYQTGRGLLYMLLEFRRSAVSVNTRD